MTVVEVELAVADLALVAMAAETVVFAGVRLVRWRRDRQRILAVAREIADARARGDDALVGPVFSAEVAGGGILPTDEHPPEEPR